MPSDASAQKLDDALAPQAPTFTTFAEYQSYIESTSAYPALQYQHRKPDEDLWLLQFPSSNRSLNAYRYQPSPQESSSYPQVSAANTSANAEALGFRNETSPEVFQSYLNGRDSDVEYQVVLLALGYKGHPPNWAVDILGLGLDMEPPIWDYLISRTRDHQKRAVVWIDQSQLIDIGHHSLVFLDAAPSRRPKTALLILQNGYKFDQIQCFDKVSRFAFPPGPAPSAVDYPEPPSRAHQPRAHCNLPAQGEDQENWEVRRTISSSSENLDIYGHGNFLFTSLDALLRLHLNRPSRNVPYFNSFGESMKLRYAGSDNDRIEVDSRILWTRLRGEADHQRLNLTALPSFVASNFDSNEKLLKRKLNELQGKWERYVKELEMAESRLRDHIAILASQKSTEMAERSIAESKRVILCMLDGYFSIGPISLSLTSPVTSLAFVFLPISLASSVYGMNIQEINGTGHPIGAFLTTAILLMLVTLALWSAAAKFAGFRNKKLERYQEFQTYFGPKVPLSDELIVHGPWPFIHRRYVHLKEALSDIRMKGIMFTVKKWMKELRRKPNGMKTKIEEENGEEEF